MKKIVSLLVILITVLIVLCGCGNKLTSGEVYNKEFKKSHKEVRMIPITGYTGKTTSVTMIPYLYTYPDRYIVYIKKFINNKWETNYYYVSKDVYNNINIGDEFEYVKGRDLDNEPYTRERNNKG